MAVQLVHLLNQKAPLIITGGLVARGAYDNATDYAIGDSVDYNGSSYVMYVNATAGTLPTDTTKWQVLAEKGDTGATGAAGANGTNGTDGADGDAATVTVGATDTVASGSPATVTNSGTTSAAILDFEIPAGANGADGADGLMTSVVAGTNITVDDTDPANPIINATAVPIDPATDIALGTIQLAGDLGGTATSPTVPGLLGKQDTLVSGTNIKTVNGTTLLGSGDITISGGGSDLYDAVIAPSGGDYTSISAAITAGKTSLYVRNGTYTENTQIVLGYRVSITGESQKGTIIDFTSSSSGFNITGNEVSISNLSILPTAVFSNPSYYYIIVDGDKCELKNLTLSSVSAAGGSLYMLKVRGNLAHVHNCFFEGYYNHVSGTPITFDNAYSGVGVRVHDNYFKFNSGNSASGCVYSGMDTFTFTDNTFYLVSTNSGTAIAVNLVASNGLVVSGNLIRSDMSTGQTGLKISGTNALVSGNSIFGFATNFNDTGTTTAIGSTQSTYDYVVAPSGGTHTTLGAAVAVATAGQSIYVRAGSYSESAITSSTNNLTIVGENMNSTILTFSGNPNFSGTGVQVANMTWSCTTYICSFGGTRAKIRNMYFERSASSANALVQCTSTGQEIRDSYFTNTTGTTSILLNVTQQSITIQGCTFYKSVQGGSAIVLASTATYANIVGNEFLSGSGTTAGQFITTNSSYFTITGNIFYTSVKTNAVGINMVTNGYGVISSNHFNNFTTAINVGSGQNAISSNFFMQSNAGVIVTQSLNSITGNKFDIASSQTGITLTGANYTQVAGNIFNGGATGMTLDSSTKYCNVVGNQFMQQSTAILTDAGLNNQISGNQGMPATINSEVLRMKNTSGASVLAGDVVIWKATATGDEITTTTTAGDSKVFGIASETVVNNAYGYFLTKGKTVLLKVDGTTDIAIGDYLTTFTTAGISAKATTGNTAFAIALEAYTADNSSGVIDALLITPKIV